MNFQLFHYFCTSEELQKRIKRDMFWVKEKLQSKSHAHTAVLKSYWDFLFVGLRDFAARKTLNPAFLHHFEIRLQLPFREKGLFLDIFYTAHLVLTKKIEILCGEIHVRHEYCTWLIHNNTKCVILHKRTGPVCEITCPAQIYLSMVVCSNNQIYRL